MPSGPLQGMHEFFKELSRTRQQGISAMCGEDIPAPGALRSPGGLLLGIYSSPARSPQDTENPEMRLGADCDIEAKGG